MMEAIKKKSIKYAIFKKEIGLTFIEFKKLLLDAEITIPKFSKLIKVSEKNLQAYKKKGEVPNPIAALAATIAAMHKNGLNYREVIESLSLELKKKSGAGFAKTKKSGKTKKEETVEKK